MNTPKDDSNPPEGFKPLFRTSPFLDHNGPFFYRENDDGTERGHQQHDGRHAARPEPVECYAGWKLGDHEGRQIHRGHDADRGVVEAKLAVQRRRHHGVQRAEQEAQEVAQRKRQERREDQPQARSPVRANTALACTMRSSPTFR